MIDDNALFFPVRDFYVRNLITCRHDHSVITAAQIMRERSIPSIIACRDGEPVGVMTDRDLRKKVVAGGLNLRKTKVYDVMSSPIVTVSEDDTLFEVIYRMSKYRIHQLGVVNTDNQLVGIISDTDIFSTKKLNPQQLLRELDEASSLAEVKKVYGNIEALICFLSSSGVHTSDLLRLISLLNDQTLRRVIDLITGEQFTDLPKGVAFVVLGSEGRREQTLKTDQDNAIIYADDLGDADISLIEAFSQAVIAGFIEIGLPECPGGIMARNEFWRRSLKNWQEAIDGWIAIPTGEHILNFSMFSDVRWLWGDVSMVEQIKEHLLRAAESERFMKQMAANVCRFAPPLGFFGGIKSEKNGGNFGMIDLKKAGIFALTEGIKTLALKTGTLEGSTLEKLAMLKEKGIIDSKQASDLDAAFNLLCFFRLRSQVKSLNSGEKPDNFITPGVLNRVRKGRLQNSLEVVKFFVKTLKHRFELNGVHE